MKKLDLQKRLAATVLKTSKKKVWFDEQSTEEIKQAITKIDIKRMVNEGRIGAKQTKNVSRGRARKIQTQKQKGRQRGQGSRKGKQNARMDHKRTWINRIRLQRTFLKDLKDKELLTTKDYRMLYLKSKGGFFRSRRHLKMYIEEHKLFQSKK